jgi:RNA-dependent RNA polymerase
MCSGSDLDGDLYFASWDDLLIPNEVHEPMDYSSSAQTNKSTDVVINDVIEFFVEFIETDQVFKTFIS